MAAQTLARLIQSQPYQIVFLQLIGVVALASLMLILKNGNDGFSTLLGGLAYVVPTYIFVWRVFRFVRSTQMTLFIAAFFFGEAIKLVSGAVLFLLIVNYLPVNLLFVLIGYVGAIVLFWVACMWEFSVKPKLSKKN